MGRMAKDTFRPYLTREELDSLLILLSSSASLSSTIHKNIYKKLKTLTLKIDEEIISAAYTTKRIPIEDSLGFSTSKSKENFTKVVEQLYEEWKTPETRIKLTLAEIKLVQDYRYRNDLMTPEEEAEYETNLS